MSRSSHQESHLDCCACVPAGRHVLCSPWQKGPGSATSPWLWSHHCPLGWLHGELPAVPAEEELGHWHSANPPRQSHGAGAVLHLGHEDGVVMELPPRVVPGRRIPVKGSTCHTGMPSAEAVVETLRCLNCKVVREAGSQGLVQVMAFFISHWHPK